MQTKIALEGISPGVGDLVRALGPGDEILLTIQAQPVARILPLANCEIGGKRPGFGSWKGKINAPEENDSIPDDFSEYIR